MSRAPLKLLAFDGAFNLPLWVAESQGFFARQGLEVTLAFTPTSGFLVQALMKGSADIALCGFDNIAAYQLGQGEAELAEPPDLRAFMAGDPGFLALVARPGIDSIAALRGATLSVDALSTGFAFVLREMLARAGLAADAVQIVRAGGTATRYAELLAGRHDATLLRTPYERLAMAQGFRLLGRPREWLGPYLGTVAAARRRWIDAHRGSVAGFLQAYREALRWIADPGHAAEACAELIAQHEGLDAMTAPQVLQDLLDREHGLVRDMAFDRRAIDTVLALRGKYGAALPVDLDPAGLLALDIAPTPGIGSEA